MSRGQYFFFLPALFIFCLDRFTKEVVLRLLPLNESQPFISPLIYWTHLHNTGAAFSLLKGQKWLFLLVAAVVAALLILYSFRLSREQLLLSTGMGLLLGGTLGNLYDRMVLQYVVDFIDLRVWPVFNVADMAIDVGVALILYDTFFPKKPSPTHNADAASGGS